MPQLERSSKGGKICFWRGQNFWVGLVFIKFSVNIQKKKDHRANMVYFSPRSRLVSKKKSNHFETAARVAKVWVGMLGSLRGRSFVLEGAAPFCPPPLVAALTHVSKKLFKTINDKQITVFIAIKRRPYFSIIIYSFNLCCSLKAKSIFQVSKIYRGGQLFDFECGHD